MALSNKAPSFWLISLIFMATLSILPATGRAAAPVYTDSLASGWEDWSWGEFTRNFTNPTPTHSGNASIAVTYTSGWSGLLLGQTASIDIIGLDTLRFWAHGGTSGGQPVDIMVCIAPQTCMQYGQIALQANTWTQVDVPVTELGNKVWSITWFNNSDHAQPTFYLDDIAFVASGTLPPPPISGPELSVDVSTDRHSISPYIYGMNYGVSFTDESLEALAAELRLPVRRWGGNSATRYNWQNDTHNTGSDWYFENIREDNSNPGALPNGSAADRFIEQDRRTQSKTLMTAPLIGWTPKRRLEDHPYDCGFSTDKYGAQQSTDPWDSKCGNGIGTNGVPITGNDSHDTSSEVTPDFVTEWVQHLIDRYGTADQGGVLFYNLDNEPMLWNTAHRDVHPQPVSYDEIWNLTRAYAAAIKATDPGAKTLGPVVWGWMAYFWSALDGVSNNSDRLAHGDTPFLEWYLQQMRAYEQQQGVRILDYLDVHFYPQANGVYSTSAGDGNTQALRLRSTRSLWDPTYTDESWIGQPVYLIPRLREWVANHYPGTQLAISEYNWGALGFLNGALAQADILGIFGRERVDLATLWGPPEFSQPGAMAFRMYRNYDGVGDMFGNVSVHAASTNQDQLAIYAAEQGPTLTLMIINKTKDALISTVTLSGFNAAAATGKVYRYSVANLNAIVREADQVVSEAGFTTTFPASSITLIAVADLAAAATTLITHYYVSILEREPEPDGLAFWQALIADTEARGEDVKDVFRRMADFFFNSSEYVARNTTDRQFITNLYLTFVQREPDEEGLAFWLDRLAQGDPRNSVMTFFLYSQEFLDFMLKLGF